MTRYEMHNRCDYLFASALVHGLPLARAQFYGIDIRPERDGTFSLIERDTGRAFRARIEVEEELC